MQAEMWRMTRESDVTAAAAISQTPALGDEAPHMSVAINMPAGTSGMCLRAYLD